MTSKRLCVCMCKRDMLHDAQYMYLFMHDMRWWSVFCFCVR